MLSYSPAMSIWKKLRYKLEWFGLQVLYILIPLLPRKAAHGLSKILGSLGFAVDKRGRNTAPSLNFPTRALPRRWSISSGASA